MKILYLTPDYQIAPLQSTEDNDLIDALSLKGVHLSIVTDREGEAQVSHGGYATVRDVDLGVVFGTGLISLLRRGSILKRIRDIALLDVGVDMIIVRGYGYVDKVYKWLSTHIKAPIVCDLLSSPIIRGDDKTPLRERYALLKAEQIWRYCDRVVVGSELERETLLRAGVATAKIVVIPPWRKANSTLALEGERIGEHTYKENKSIDKYIDMLTTLYINKD
ncbi:MAG: glycosyltransferase [Clostridia bacterium]|nr:glycosyltransferase [Clostridia bacterium]